MRGHARRVLVLVVGTVVVAAGIVLLPIPGPGWLVIFAGLTVLAQEFEPARRAQRWLRRQLRRTYHRVRSGRRVECPPSQGVARDDWRVPPW